RKSLPARPSRAMIKELFARLFRSVEQARTPALFVPDHDRREGDSVVTLHRALNAASNRGSAAIVWLDAPTHSISELRPWPGASPGNSFRRALLVGHNHETFEGFTFRPQVHPDRGYLGARWWTQVEPF